MKQLLLLLLLLAVACYGCKENDKPKPVTATSPDFAKAKAYYSNKKDSSFYFFNQVVNNSKDSHQIAVAYNYMATIQIEAGDYFGSQESSLIALKHLNESKRTDSYSLYSVYTLLGNNCLNLKNYDAAIDYYGRALKFAISDNSKLFPLNGKAVAYQKKQKYSEAIEIYSAIIDQSVNNKSEYARILSNMARAKWLRNDSYPAISEFMTALRIRESEKDNWGLNASYSHLSDYYSASHPDSALIYARKMYIMAQLINNPDDKLEALQKLMKLSPAKELSTYINLYQHLNDSIQTARNNAKNQFALIRYEAEKNKADKLVLQKDNAEKMVQIIQQRITLYIIIAVFILAAVFAVNWYRKRKQRMEWESQNAIRENKLQWSREVHDVVANGIYSIMTRLDHEPGIKKEQLLDKLEILYEKSRNISYEEPVRPSGGFDETITALLTSFAGPATKVVEVGNNNDLWTEVNVSIRKELEHVLQELMVNMKKHSRAKNVAVKFEREDNRMVILYQDDGIGLTSSFQYGNGLNNTENRIKSIGGQITFEKAGMIGLKIRISFPIA